MSGCDRDPDECREELRRWCNEQGGPDAAVVAAEFLPRDAALPVTAVDENLSCTDRESLQNLALSRSNRIVRIYVFIMTTMGRKNAAVEPVTKDERV